MQVYGDWLPRALFGKCSILCTFLRGLWLSMMVLLFERAVDAVVCDQLALYLPTAYRFQHRRNPSRRCCSYVPFMRLKAKVMFYCHYPDKLLAPKGGLLRRLYRFLPRFIPPLFLISHGRVPFDSAEEHCTLSAHAVVVNSKFTKTVFMRAFPAAKREPGVLYPCVTLAPSPKPDGEVLKQLRGRTVFLSINRCRSNDAAMFVTVAVVCGVLCFTTAFP